MVLLIFWFLYLQLSQLRRDPADYLSDTSRLFTIPLWLMFLLMTIYELVIYFRWGRRAKEAAEHGVFLPVRAHPWLSWAAVGLATVFLLFSFSASSDGLLFLFSCQVTVIPILLANWMLGALKGRGVSRRVNLAVTSAVVFVLAIVGTGAVAVGAAIQGWRIIPGEESQPVGQYDWDGLTMDNYDDPPLPRREDLVRR